MRVRLSCPVLCLLIIAAICGEATPAWSQARDTITIRGHPQSLYLYGPRAGDPVIVSSGDGGWIHLAPHVGEFLGSRGFFVVGFDVKAYLSGFTSRDSTLGTDEEPRDYRVLAEFAKRNTGKKPILIGVSEGAGLSVLAATDPPTKADLLGVIGLGLPDLNELGWRWRDMLIYLTHGVPNEPSFSTSAMVDRVAPLPLAAIHSTHDEFVPIAEVERVMNDAREPKRLWIVNASNHRFSDRLEELDQRLLDAITWVKARSPH
jgi:fermentation-respiration switch protein FrsA (DUF1100 family)